MTRQLGRFAVEVGQYSDALLTSFDSLALYNEVFGALGWIAIGSGIFLLLLIPILRKWMHGIH